MAEIEQFQPGFRLVDGTQLNELVDTVNNLTGEGTPQAGTFTTVNASGLITASGGVSGAVNGTLGATTPAAATVTDLTQNGNIVATPQILAAAGATQGNAAAITKSTVIVTVTASTQGVKLPTAATGKEVRVFCPGAVGVKVYPFAGDKISTASTNAAVLLVADKANIYLAKNTSLWCVLKGA